MDLVHRRCAGLDVHQATGVACVRWVTGRTVQRETREFGTCTRDLRALGDWLRTHAVTHVLMEATGVYWKPVWHVLAGDFDVVLANAAAVRHVPGLTTPAILSNRWSLYFYVPRGTATVGGFAETTGWGAAGALLDGSGNVVHQFDAEAGYFSVAVPPGEDGKLWKFDNSGGTRQLMTVPPFLARRADELLLPRQRLSFALLLDGAAMGSPKLNAARRATTATRCRATAAAPVAGASVATASTSRGKRAIWGRRRRRQETARPTPLLRRAAPARARARATAG